MPEPVAFILQFLLQAAAIFFLLRFVLQAVRADVRNPLSSSIIKLTNPVLQPLRYVLPSFRNLDTASFVTAWVALTLMVATGWNPQYTIIMVLTAGLYWTLNFIVWIFLITIFATIILSWVAPGSYSPFAAAAHQIAEPALAPARKLLPPISGIDLSPIITVLALTLIKGYVLPLLLAS